MSNETPTADNAALVAYDALSLAGDPREALAILFVTHPDLLGGAIARALTLDPSEVLGALYPDRTAGDEVVKATRIASPWSDRIDYTSMSESHTIWRRADALRHDGNVDNENDLDVLAVVWSDGEAYSASVPELGERAEVLLVRNAGSLKEAQRIADEYLTAQGWRLP